MASTFLTRTVSGSDSTYTYKRNTVSVWLKRSGLGDACFFEGWYSNAFATQVYFDSNTNLTINAASSTAGSAFQIVTNRKFRDINSWYHIVISIDTTDATSTDRCKIYVNGVRETSFASASYPNQNASVQWSGTGNTQFVGRRESGGAGLYYDGAMSYLAYIDGTAELPTIFGETDTTTGQWKIKTSITPSVAWGNFGFLILKDGNSLTDASPNSNNFTVGAGTLTDTKDCPSNVFATWNVLDSHYFWGAEESSWCTNGNTTARTGNSQYSSCTATLGASSGKYYWEFKYVAKSGSDNLWHLGIKSTQDTATTTALGVNSTDYAYKAYNGQSMSDNSSSAYGSTYAVGDIIGIAMDLDNNKLYFSKNGTWQNSGVPTSGSTGTGAISIAAASTTEFGVYVPAFSWNDGSSYGTNSVNFGNGFFGTSAVADNSTATASTPGVFNYDVPTGYQPLTTKGLNA